MQTLCHPLRSNIKLSNSFNIFKFYLNGHDINLQGKKFTSSKHQIFFFLCEKKKHQYKSGMDTTMPLSNKGRHKQKNCFKTRAIVVHHALFFLVVQGLITLYPKLDVWTIASQTNCRSYLIVCYIEGSRIFLQHPTEKKSKMSSRNKM